MKIISAVALALLVLVSPMDSLAWNDAGHKITSYIAWKQMTPQARAKAVELLMAAPEDSMLSAYFSGDSSRSLEIRNLEIFTFASTWPDVVRDRKFPVRYEKYHRSNWHYQNTFWTTRDGKPEFTENPEGVDGGKLIEKLAEFEKTLADPNASNSDKAIALAWFLHLAGDIHQPLHASGRITDVEPKGDLGGNLFLLTPAGTPRDQQMNLHWYWDSIVTYAVDRKDACDGDYLPPLAASMSVKFPVSGFGKSLISASFGDWKLESAKLAMTRVFPSTLERGRMPDAKYKEDALRISEERLAASGHRIAAILNRVLVN
jgi:hypothetical protein